MLETYLVVHTAANTDPLDFTSMGENSVFAESEEQARTKILKRFPGHTIISCGLDTAISGIEVIEDVEPVAQTIKKNLVIKTMPKWLKENK